VVSYTAHSEKNAAGDGVNRHSIILVESYIDILWTIYRN